MDYVVAALLIGGFAALAAFLYLCGRNDERDKRERDGRG